MRQEQAHSFRLLFLLQSLYSLLSERSRDPNNYKRLPFLAASGEMLLPLRDYTAVERGGEEASGHL